MKLLHCPRCKNQVYYENTSCEKCFVEFGFSPQQMDMVEIGEEVGHVACPNRSPTPVCNWVLSADTARGFCSSCELTSTIPPLDSQKNLQRWVKVEAAKRRLLYTLLALGLKLDPKQSAAGRGGIEFRWLVPQAGVHVTTGHERGVITLNMLEVDDGEREVQRERLNEYMRTVLGHLRHEVAHHLFEEHVMNTDRLAGFRQLFGDETRDYGKALADHYAGAENGNWQSAFVSAYAASHPLEDWAETTAHYLLMVDALETATSWGLSLASQQLTTAEAPMGSNTGASTSSFSNEVVAQWLTIARFLNAMSRSLGLRDSYSYLIPPTVVQKLQFVHETLNSVSTQVRNEAKTFAK